MLGIKTNKHCSALVGTSVQLTLVWLVILGQIPQDDDKIVKWLGTRTHPVTFSWLQLKLITLFNIEFINTWLILKLTVSIME